MEDVTTDKDVLDRNPELFAQLEERVRDAQIERGHHEDQWRINNQLFMGIPASKIDARRPLPAERDPDMHGGIAKHTTGTMRTFSINRVQNAVIVQTAVQTEQIPRPTYRPRETNEPPDVFLRHGVIERVAEQGLRVDQMGLTPDQIAGREVLADEQVEALMALTVEQTEVVETEVPVNGGAAQTALQEVPVRVPVVTEQDFIAVTDQLASEALTQELNSEWDLAGGDEIVQQNIFETNVIGHVDGLVQWNVREQRIELLNLYPYNCWIDRWATTTRDAQYYITRQVLDFNESRRLFPDISAEIMEEVAKSSDGDNPWWGGLPGGKYTGNTDRKTVDLWTWWERDIEMKLSADEAINRGLVVIEQDEEGNTIAVLAETGEQTAPSADNWPTEFGLRQIDMLGDVVIYNGPASFSDIPAARNRNIPIPQSPYAQGEPQRLGDLQQLYERLWAIFHEHFRYFAHPEQAIPQSVYNDLEDAMATLHSSAARTLSVPDSLWQMFNGQIIQTIPVPQLGNAIFQMVAMVGNEIDRMAGIADVLRGEAKSEWSAALFERATSAARGPIGFKARHTAQYLVHTGTVAGHLILDFLTAEEWAKRNKKYPPQIFEAMRSRLKRFGFDVKAQVGGSGDVEKEQSQMMQLFTSGMVRSPTFNRMLLEKFQIPNAEQIARELAAASAPAPTEESE